MDKDSFADLVDQLEDLEWFIFSGLAVKIYSGSDRDFSDVDIVVKDQDIEEFADRLNTEVKDRDFVKEGNHITDRAFETEFEGIEVEATSGFPEKRMTEGTLDKLFDRTNQMEFRSQKVRVEPLEELMVHKAKMDRDKDRRDLRLLNDLDFDRKFVLEIVEDWGLQKDKVLSILREENFDI